jgi:hypothetical protein
MFSVRVVEKIKIHILCLVTFFSENLSLCEIRLKNVVESERPQMAIWRRVAWWISRITRTHSQKHTHKYATLIAFSRQQWFRERASVLSNTHISCLVIDYKLTKGKLSWLLQYRDCVYSCCSIEIVFTAAAILKLCLQLLQYWDCVYSCCNIEVVFTAAHFTHYNTHGIL